MKKAIKIMLLKSGESKNDLVKYRPICLLWNLSKIDKTIL